MLSPEELRQRRKERILQSAADRIRKICTDEDRGLRAAPFFEAPGVPSAPSDPVVEVLAPRVGNEEVPTIRRTDDAVPRRSPVFQKKTVFSFGILLLQTCSFPITLIVGFILALANLYDPELSVFVYWFLAQVVLSSLRYKFRELEWTQAEIFKQLMLLAIDPKLAKYIEISLDLITSVFRDTKSFMFSFVVSRILLNAAWIFDE